MNSSSQRALQQRASNSNGQISLTTFSKRHQLARFLLVSSQRSQILEFVGQMTSSLLQRIIEVSFPLQRMRQPMRPALEEDSLSSSEKEITNYLPQSTQNNRNSTFLVFLQFLGL